MDSKAKARRLIARAYVELRKSGDQKSFQAQNELIKVIETLNKPVALAG